MTPMRYRHNVPLPFGNWATNPIGRAYIRLHPRLEFQYYHATRHVYSGVPMTTDAPVHMVNGVFPKGILTINFSNGYHLDPNDRNALTHCTVTTPNATIKEIMKKKGFDEEDEQVLEKMVGGVFALGHNVFDYSEANFNFIFSGAAISHTTGIPYNVPDMPKVVTGNKSYASVVKHQKEMDTYLKESVLAWAGFGASNSEWLKKCAQAGKKRSIGN